MRVRVVLAAEPREELAERDARPPRIVVGEARLEIGLAPFPRAARARKARPTRRAASRHRCGRRANARPARAAARRRPAGIRRTDGRARDSTRARGSAPSTSAASRSPPSAMRLCAAARAILGIRCSESVSFAQLRAESRGVVLARGLAPARARPRARARLPPRRKPCASPADRQAEGFPRIGRRPVARGARGEARRYANRPPFAAPAAPGAHRAVAPCSSFNSASSMRRGTARLLT